MSEQYPLFEKLTPRHLECFSGKPYLRVVGTNHPDEKFATPQSHVDFIKRFGFGYLDKPR